MTLSAEGWRFRESGLGRSKRMKVRLRFDHWIPKRLNVGAITLYPFILFPKPWSESRYGLLHHEMIHVRQIRSLGVIRFYLTYLYDYLLGLIATRSHERAYRGIRFEVEAYSDQSHILLTAQEADEVLPQLKKEIV
jgi:hypothetical protein